MDKVIYLPVEFYQREFGLKLYLALLAVKRGYKVIIGDASSFYFRFPKKSFILLKDTYSHNSSFFVQCLRHHMIVGALDEEGLIINESNFLNAVDASNLQHYHKLFYWGDIHRNLLAKSSQSVLNNLIPSGSLKFDVIESINRKKDYFKPSNKFVKRILINTRFALSNGLRGSIDAQLELYQRQGLYLHSSGQKKFYELINNEIIIFNEFLEFIKILGSDRSKSVVIRPHPAEDDSVYNKIADIFPNITVNYKDELYAQILSSDCVIHDACTTGIEAAAFGIPVLGLRPKLSGESYTDFANQFSYNFLSARQLYDFICTNPMCEWPSSPIADDASSLIHNWRGINGFCSDTILDNFDLYPSQNAYNLFSFIAFSKDLIRYLLFISLNIIFGMLPLKWRPNSYVRRHSANRKFPLLSRSRVQSTLTYFQSLANVESNDVSLDFVSLKVLLIRPK